jgi:type VI secretion system secreted protein Hcp
VLSVSALADDMFLKLDGIAGESTANKHPKEIEVESYSWGLSSTGAASTGAARAGSASAATIDQFVISKRVDSASPHLFRAALTGTRLKSATFVVVRAGAGKAASEYIRITLEDVSVVSIKSGGTQNAAPLEQVAFNFRKASYSYSPAKPDGSMGTAIQVDLDPGKK